MDVPLSVLVFCSLKSASSSACRSAWRPSEAAAANAFILSPASHFGVASTVMGSAQDIQCGVNSSIATLPQNFIAFEYPARFEPFWYDITEGFDGVPVRNGMIDVPDRPGIGVDLIPHAARAYLSEGDADFFD